MSVCLDYFNCTDEKSRGRNKPKTLDFDSQLDFWGGGICKFIFYIQGLFRIFKTRFQKYSLS